MFFYDFISLSNRYNVILPAELKAKSELPAEINKLVMKANKKAIELFGNAA